MEIEVKVQYKNERLQAVRQAAGLSQSQLAKAAGLSVRMLQNYESGLRDLNGAKLSTLLKLSLALRCKLSDIITDNETLQLLDDYSSNKKKKEPTMKTQAVLFSEYLDVTGRDITTANALAHNQKMAAKKFPYTLEVQETLPNGIVKNKAVFSDGSVINNFSYA